MTARPLRTVGPADTAVSVKPELRLDAFLPYRLSLASNVVSNLIHETYESLFALRIPEWRVTAILGEVEGLTQMEIGQRTKMDKVTVSRAAKALQERKLVARSVNEADGRSSRLALTTEGRALYEAVAPAALAIEGQLLADFSAREVEELKRTLLRLEEAAHKLSKRR
ncbi:MarR family winged helix-turn-helix transcriptional regulator [Chitinasiproducens palmae]|uniref:DNA-binding transcriptional regulator, MarR family n=1 Tax=Chitinasiproducens palmae TaxID=1770053 RepID=A0A1H2PJN7_9BURK|nr:MarR family transcriptional regulator [Chitinasiproducens palmae]SDV46083.1 DNA-binding transcriptional regulator, MarR family [Chitinasiproducens palmae]